jgi:hypothetical protein
VFADPALASPGGEPHVWRKASQNRNPPPACAQRPPAAAKLATVPCCRRLHGSRIVHHLRKKSAHCPGGAPAHLQPAVNCELSLRMLEHLRWTCHASSASHAMTARLGRPQEVAGPREKCPCPRHVPAEVFGDGTLARHRSLGAVKDAAVPILELQTCLKTSSMR